MKKIQYTEKKCTKNDDKKNDRNKDSCKMRKQKIKDTIKM